MERSTLKSDPSVVIHLRRSSRARKISLRVSELDGRVTLTLPNYANVDTALAFAEDKSEWILKQLSNQVASIPVGIGTSIPLGGQNVAVEIGSVSETELRDGRLILARPPVLVATRVATFLRNAARSMLGEACRDYSRRLGLSFGKMTLRDTRSRWGSCSIQGDLMFSWRLSMAPHEVLDYVAAHEVAHLVEMNHSPAYWAVVARICPGYAAPRAWLKANGRTLHRYKFEDTERTLIG